MKLSSEDDVPKVKNEEVSKSQDASPVKSHEAAVKEEDGDFIYSSRSSPKKRPVVKEAEEEELEIIDDKKFYSSGASNQLVLYNPEVNGSGQIEAVPEPEYHPPQVPHFPSGHSSRVLPSVGAFTVQCASCFKWRLIPTKEKYEEIRESILQKPFVCEKAQEWRPTVTCDDEADINQDGSRLWAIDKPNISQPPAGWERLLRIRGEGGSKFADVYYVAPTGKKLRSMVDVQKFLVDHPEHITNGVTLSQFSFQIPKPLQENYVRKRGTKVDLSARLIEPTEVNPLSWVGPMVASELQIGGTKFYEAPIIEPLSSSPPAANKQSTKSSCKKRRSSSNKSPLYDHQSSRIKLEEPQTSRTDMQ